MSFNVFVHKYNLKNKATTKIKIQQVLSSLSLNYVGIYMRDAPFKFEKGIVDLHPSKWKHWVAFLNENFNDRVGCWPTKKLFKFIIKRNRYCLYSQYKSQCLTHKKHSIVQVIIYISFIWQRIEK